MTSLIADCRELRSGLRGGLTVKAIDGAQQSADGRRINNGSTVDYLVTCQGTAQIG